MQFAKKLALVDPKTLDQLQADREYKVIQRPAAAVAKTSLSLDIGRILNDQSIPDDEKVKLYQNALRRYVNIRDEIPTQTADQPTQPVVQPTELPTELWPQAPRLFTTGLSSKPQSPVKRLQIRKKHVKWERTRELPHRIRRKPIKWEAY